MESDGDVQTSSGQADDTPKRWDDGLSKEERAAAKRKYKNRRGAERWRRRKWEQFAREAAEVAAGGAGLVQGAPIAGSGLLPSSSTEQDGLFERSHLPASEEVSLLAELQRIASFSILPDGFQRHKEEILFLAEKAVCLAHGGAPDLVFTANRYLAYGVTQRAEWFSPGIPNFTQVCTAFAQGCEENVMVSITRVGKPCLQLSLKSLAQLPESIQLELYVLGVQEVTSLLPVAFSTSPGAAAAIEAVSQRSREMSMLLATYAMGQSSIFSLRRNVCRPGLVPISQLMSAAANMGLDVQTCKKLWQVWDDTLKRMGPVKDAQAILEQEVELLLQSMDDQFPKPYAVLLEKVQSLLAAHRAAFDIGHQADQKCFQEILTPFQVAIIAAAELPNLSVRQALIEGVDLVLRVSPVFENGLIPYRLS